MLDGESLTQVLARHIQKLKSDEEHLLSSSSMNINFAHQHQDRPVDPYPQQGSLSPCFSPACVMAAKERQEENWLFRPRSNFGKYEERKKKLNEEWKKSFQQYLEQRAREEAAAKERLHLRHRNFPSDVVSERSPFLTFDDDKCWQRIEREKQEHGKVDNDHTGKSEVSMTQQVHEDALPAETEEFQREMNNMREKYQAILLSHADDHCQQKVGHPGRFWNGRFFTPCDTPQLKLQSPLGLPHEDSLGKGEIQRQVSPGETRKCGIFPGAEAQPYSKAIYRHTLEEQIKDKQERQRKEKEQQRLADITHLQSDIWMKLNTDNQATFIKQTTASYRADLQRQIEEKRQLVMREEKRGIFPNEILERNSEGMPWTEQKHVADQQKHEQLLPTDLGSYKVDTSPLNKARELTQIQNPIPATPTDYSAVAVPERNIQLERVKLSDAKEAVSHAAGTPLDSGSSHRNQNSSGRILSRLTEVRQQLQERAITSRSSC